jgi:glycosyltransferase involved in cell wall biosynthesis
VKTIAIVGTNGVPAAYGGFETLADNLVQYLEGRFRFVVYCSKTPKAKRLPEYHGARLIYVPLRANGWQSLIYDCLTTLHAFFTADVILLLGPGFGFVLPLNAIFRRRLIVNYGGLDEWEREKLSRLQKSYTYASTDIAARSASVNVADNEQLRRSLRRAFGAEAAVIRYGGDHAQRPVAIDPALRAKYPFLSRPYFVSMSRAQVDNNLHLVIDAFKRTPGQRLVLISNWTASDYGRQLFADNQGLPNITLLPAIYDQAELNAVRSRGRAYVHSHSRCGTAPSLVEAISLGLPIISFDVATNRETTADKALYFGSADELAATVASIDDQSLARVAHDLAPLAAKAYRWRHIADQYARLFEPAAA